MEGDVCPEKVHIRGLDNLATTDLKLFIEENQGSSGFERIEWVDDTSANFIYESAEASLQALLTFSLTQDVDPASLPVTQLRPAKSLSTHPDSMLSVRQAFTTDVKKSRAHEASRFYLMNPDKDPREMKRQRRDRGDGPQRRKRRQDDRDMAFDESMYDDDSGATDLLGPRKSPLQFSDDGGDDRRKRVRFDGNRGRDLFSKNSKSDGRLRNRSASPGKEGDGRFGFAEETSRSRRRSVTPPTRNRPSDLLPQRRGIELFPDKAGSVRGVELFPNKTPPAKSNRDLFPNKTPLSNHRRTDAFDAKDETSPVAFHHKQKEKTRDLFERINRPQTSFGRLSDAAQVSSHVDVAQADSTDDISVLGQAKGAQAGGFSIRGAAQGTEKSAQELFPDKFSNDLFAEKIQGRGGPRKRAQDLFG